jgi:alpha-tubulin suppressor-like RCC1 family protein
MKSFKFRLLSFFIICSLILSAGGIPTSASQQPPLASRGNVQPFNELSIFLPNKANKFRSPDTIQTNQKPSMENSSQAIVITKISTGGFHTCALTTGGGVKCWGYNAYGQLGDNLTTNRLAPVDVTGLTSGVSAIEAGENHTCAITTSGGAKCWGYNAYGQLGDNSTTYQLAPVDVTGLTSGVSVIVGGEYHTCALTTGGGVKCWGSNIYGQLGDNSTINRLTPVDVTGLTSGVSAIAVGVNHTCAITTSGGVKCWGRNSEGQLGDNTMIQRLTPVNATGLTSGISKLAVGRYHTCALTTGGGMQCWGSNGYGQLGDNSTTNRLAPVDVTGLISGVSAIAAGGYHTCALTASGGMKCWGSNVDGQLGNNSNINRNTPVDVTGLTSGVFTIAGGGYHTCAITTSGGAKCWGRNSQGQLGDDTTVWRRTPVNVVGLTGGYYDFKIEYLNWSPPTPIAMEQSTLYITLKNDGTVAYVPTTGQYDINIKMIDTHKTPNKYWIYRRSGSGLPLMNPAGTQDIILEFWFTRPEQDLIEVTLIPSDGDDFPANNTITKNITISPPKNSMLDCLSVVLDIILAYTKSIGVDLDVITEISLSFTVTLTKIGAASMNNDWGQAWDAVGTFLVKSAITIGNKYLNPFTWIKDWLFKFLFGAWDAIQCGFALSDFFTLITDKANSEGMDMNTAYAESPIYVLIENNSNQRAGFLNDGSIITEIPGSDAAQTSNGKKLVIYPGQDTKTVTLKGTGTGTFDLTLAIGKADSTTHNIKYRNVPITANAVGIIDAQSTLYLIKIDDNGDGNPDRTITPNEIIVKWPGIAYLPIAYNVCSSNVNNNPYISSNPSPAGGTTNQNVNLSLSWTGGDPDGDVVTYDVYLAANNPTPSTKICTNISTAGCNPGALTAGITYYWQVVAKDEHGLTSTSPVWNFTTSASGIWGQTGPMNIARTNHTASLLNNGKVLVTGGYNSSVGYLASAELYDPATGTWSVTGALVNARSFNTATLLANGKVLVVGGFGNLVDLASAELYDPGTGTWSVTGALATARNNHTATLLPNGKVLVVGGLNNLNNFLASVELYDPATGTWSTTGALNNPRGYHTAMLLTNGKVLVAGGYNGSSLADAELYDPGTGTWSATGALATARYSHTATLLANGKVLVTGGYNSSVGYLASVELYDPGTGTWSATGALATTRNKHTASLLPNGKVLVAGGYNGGDLASAELFDPATGTWSATGALATARNKHTASLLPNGKVLVVGGYNNINKYLASAEYY